MIDLKRLLGVVISLSALVFSVGIAGLCLTSCEEAERHRNIQDKHHKVELYSGDGNLIHTWYTTNAPERVGRTSNYEFVDNKTGKRVEIVEGTVVITEI